MPAYDVEQPAIGSPLPPEDFGGEYELETDHVGQATDQLIDFFRQGPRNRAFVRALARQVQELEDAVWGLKQEEFLDDATGHRLDLIGLIVGEGRSGLSDDDYREAIRVRALINRSNGRIPEIAEVLRRLLPSAGIVLGEAYPAGLYVHIDDLGGASGDLIGRTLRQMKGGGVALDAGAGFAAGSIVGAEDGDPTGGIIGAEDGDPAGFLIGAAL